MSSRCTDMRDEMTALTGAWSYVSELGVDAIIILACVCCCHLPLSRGANTGGGGGGGGALAGPLLRGRRSAK